MFCMETALKLLFWSFLVRLRLACAQTVMRLHASSPMLLRGACTLSITWSCPASEIFLCMPARLAPLTLISPVFSCHLDADTGMTTMRQVYREESEEPAPGEPVADELKVEDRETQEVHGEEVCPLQYAIGHPPAVQWGASSLTVTVNPSALHAHDLIV